MSAEGLLLKTGRFLRRSVTSTDLRTLYLKGGTEGDAYYRDRWSLLNWDGRGTPAGLFPPKRGPKRGSS
ncbi:hypothetical protein [Nonomuraea helvata]|uniref:Uncharacterized protein n=1 Tax=Nonomuraea helvata TaxID=37484 RepID=A0ABV5RQT9_9ACTN